MRILPLYGFLGAVLVIGNLFLIASGNLPHSRIVTLIVFNGPWLFPYAMNLAGARHAHKLGSKEKAIGLHFVTSLWTLAFAAALTALIAGINTQLNQPLDIIQDAVILVVGMWEGLIKGLFFSVITAFIWSKRKTPTT